MDIFYKINDFYDIGARTGYTQYIDFLNPNEIPKNTMKGVDVFRRYFFTLKVGIITKKGQLIKTGQVFFQRYTDGDLWMGAYFQGEFIETCGGVDTEQFNLLRKLIKGEKVILKFKHRPLEMFDGGIIALWDVWEETFAKVIQRNFILARYNPNYQLCKNVLKRQFDEYQKGFNKFI